MSTKQGKLYWITGRSGAGKTFLSDYLQDYCGFLHIDGDSLLVSTDAQSIRLATGVYKAFYEHIFLGTRAPDELWKEYFQHFVRAVKAVVDMDPSRDIVVSFSTYPVYIRDFLRKEFRSIGKEVLFLILNIEEGPCLERMAGRLTAYVEVQGITKEQFWLATYKEDYSRANFEEKMGHILKGFEPKGINEKQAVQIEIDCSGIEILKSLHSALQAHGDTLPSTCRIEDVNIKKIANRNVERWYAIKAAKERKEAEAKQSERQKQRAVAFCVVSLAAVVVISSMFRRRKV